MNRLWFLNMNCVYQRQWTDFSSLLNWVHGCDLIQSLLQHAKLLGTRGHAPMCENMFLYRPWFWICTPLVCEIVWKCPKWIELWLNQGWDARTRRWKKWGSAIWCSRLVQFLLSFLTTERFHEFDHFFDVIGYDFRTLSEQTFKVLTSKVVSQGPPPWGNDFRYPPGVLKSYSRVPCL